MNIVDGSDPHGCSSHDIKDSRRLQDPLEYGTRTHHSNMDVYDHLQSGDLEQASAVMAWFVYNTAPRAETIPRNPLPKPGAGRGGRRQ